MLIIAFNGSPNKYGNTVDLLREGAEAAKNKGVEIEWLHVQDALEDVEIPFCYQCVDKCDGRCSENNSLGDAFDLLRKCDGILLGTPVYFGSVSGQLKAFWDMSRILRREKALLNTVGGVATSGNARFGGQETALNTAVQMMMVHGMTIVGDGYKDYDCGHFGGCAQRPSAEDQFGLERVRITMERIIEVADATRKIRN